MPLSLIAAISKNNCIGKNGTLPWHIPEDFQHFKTVTMGKVVLMGRKTWESLPEKFRPLPGRKNVVITRQTAYTIPKGVELYPTIEQALLVHPTEEVVSIGGAEIYRQTIDHADRLYITHVHQHVDGDAFFPEIDDRVWEEAARETHDGFDVVEYVRKSKV